MAMVETGLDPNKLYTIKQVATTTNLSAAQIRHACRSGVLAFVRLTPGCNSRILLSGKAVDDWLAHCAANNTHVLSPAQAGAVKERLEGGAS